MPGSIDIREEAIGLALVCRRCGKRLGRGAVCSWQRMTCAVGNDAPSSFSVCNGFVRAAAWERLAGQKVNKKQGSAELYFRRWDRKGREGSRKKTKERQGRGLGAACLDGKKTRGSVRFDSIRASGEDRGRRADAIVGRGGRGEEAQKEASRLGLMHKSSFSCVLSCFAVGRHTICACCASTFNYSIATSRVA